MLTQSALGARMLLALQVIRLLTTPCEIFGEPWLLFYLLVDNNVPFIQALDFLPNNVKDDGPLNPDHAVERRLYPSE
jgi:hypothetical protein